MLSERLRSLTDMVTRGNRVVDVGCDHGFLSIYLVQQGISPGVIAMDVGEGPLSRAREHIAEYEMTDYIETRLSDGLTEYRVGEAQSLVLAGMGGRLMMKILTDSEEKAKDLKELILQPQSEIPVFRRFLRDQGYRTLDENILCEEGKFYFLFRVCHNAGEPPEVWDMSDGQNVLYEKYGKLLLERRHPVLKQYLEYMTKTAENIESSLKNCEGERGRMRMEEIRQELVCLKKALSLF